MDERQITDRIEGGKAEPGITDRPPARPADAPVAAAPPRRKMRWWMPALIVLAAGAVIVYGRYNEDLDQATHNVLLMAPCAAAVLLLLGWYLLFTGLRWRTRWLLAAVAVAVPVVVFSFYRLEFTGDMAVRLARRPWWSGSSDASLPNISNITRDQGTAVAVSPDDFPQFLGTDRLGVVKGVALDRDWAAHPPREIWRQNPIGLGWSSFAVAGPIAVTQEQRGKDELVVARNRTDGAVVWSHATPTRFTEAMGGDGPRGTPTIAGGKVFAMGATGVLDCLDAATGKPLWSRDPLKENDATNLQWGKSCSPLVVGDLGLVVVSLGEGGAGSLVAYDVNTGAQKWIAGDGVEDKASYSSPMLLTLAGRRQIVMVNANTVTGHEPADGKVLWRYHWDQVMAPAKASQPIPLPDDRLLLLGGYNVPGVMLKVKVNGDKWDTEELYKTKSMATKFTTAVVRDHYAYGLDDGGLACIDLDQGGKQMWKVGKREGQPDRFGHGQVLLVGDLLLIQAEEPGDVVLAEANPKEFRKLGVVKALEEKTWNNPALAGNHLFVRNGHEAVCYELATVENK